MLLLFLVRVFIHLQLMQHVINGQITSMSTIPLKMFNGSTVCATDSPFQVFSSRSELDCSRTCASYVTRHCTSVNFWYSNKQCEMYSTLSVNYRVVAGCIHLQLPPLKNCFRDVTSLPSSCMVSTSTVFLPAQGLNSWLIVHELYYYANFNWNRAWNEYKMGFGTPGSNYWFGLEKLHQMTLVSTYRVRIEIHRIPQDVVLWLEMNVFYVASESQYYQLTWSGMSGSVDLTNTAPADPVTFHTGMVFSTYDCNHNLVTTYDCPNVQGGGWWFNACYAVCLTCSLHPCSSGYNGYNAAGGVVCSDYTRMMIRPA